MNTKYVNPLSCQKDKQRIWSSRNPLAPAQFTSARPEPKPWTTDGHFSATCGFQPYNRLLIRHHATSKSSQRAQDCSFHFSRRFMWTTRRGQREGPAFETPHSLRTPRTGASCEVLSTGGEKQSPSPQQSISPSSIAVTQQKIAYCSPTRVGGCVISRSDCGMKSSGF